MPPLSGSHRVNAGAGFGSRIVWVAQGNAGAESGSCIVWAARGKWDLGSG
jgi:hypothetical protein